MVEQILKYKIYKCSEICVAHCGCVELCCNVYDISKYRTHIFAPSHSQIIKQKSICWVKNTKNVPKKTV